MSAKQLRDQLINWKETFDANAVTNYILPITDYAGSNYTQSIRPATFFYQKAFLFSGNGGFAIAAFSIQIDQG